jgi:DNA-binding HxlR family transcriptional regulator
MLSDMGKSSFPSRSHCPINYALETFGDRWTLLVIRDLMFHGKRHFGDFLASDERVATNVLADRLKRLERLGLVTRSVEAQSSKPSYALTRKGRDLLPVLLEITRWSGRYDPGTNAPDALLEALERDREGLIAAVRAGWEDS